MIGSMSSGTLKTEDLLPTFADVLRSLALKGPDGDEHRKLADEADAIDFDNESMDNQDLIDGILDELQDALQEYAPTYCYFGALEGDGADFGFWVDFDAIEEAIHDGEVVQVEDLAAIPDDYNGSVVLVNDHGNMTLYNATTRVEVEEVWSVV